MSAQLVAATPMRVRVPGLGGVVLVAFVAGTLIGFGLPRANAGTDQPPASGAEVSAAPDGSAGGKSTSDAASRVVGPTPFKGVAERSMSEAAYESLYGPLGIGQFTGVASNSMSQAAWAASYGG